MVYSYSLYFPMEQNEAKMCVMPGVGGITELELNDWLTESVVAVARAAKSAALPTVGNPRDADTV